MYVFKFVAQLSISFCILSLLFEAWLGIWVSRAWDRLLHHMVSCWLLLWANNWLVVDRGTTANEVSSSEHVRRLVDICCWKICEHQHCVWVVQSPAMIFSSWWFLVSYHCLVSLEEMTVLFFTNWRGRICDMESWERKWCSMVMLASLWLCACDYVNTQTCVCVGYWHCVCTALICEHCVSTHC